MMKRLIPVLLIVCLLCGCTADPQPTETQTPTTEYAAPTEPAGSYDPDSQVEMMTNGALRAYPMEEQLCYDIAIMGGDVLLFSGQEKTVLTRLAGENLYTIARTELDVSLSPEDPSFRITGNGITYYDPTARSVVFLDNDLHEVSRVAVPEAMTGSPILSANRLKLYYCTADAIRVLDLETGLDRLLKEISYPEQSLEGILLNDTVLCCSIFDGEEEDVLFLSTATGELVGQTEENYLLTTYENQYYALIPEGTMYTYIFGSMEEAPDMLIPADPFGDTWFLENVNAAISVSMSNGELIMDYYDLETGLRSAGLELDGVNTPWCAEADEASGDVYILTDDTSVGCAVIYRWDVTQSPTGDETVYVSSRYTLENPDTEGLAACAERAEEISRQYDVEVLIGMDAVALEPWDYELYPEYQVPVIERELETLAELLATFPQGFLATLAEGTTDGPAKICLVRSITGSPESGSLDQANGVQFWDEEKAYVAVAIGDMMEMTFYHELFHVIESRVFSESNAYYEWNKLNPKGFSYDLDYIANQNRTEDAYLQDDTRAFIDTYSMSYPKEDRARIMEYAATAGNENYFVSDTMQTKLRTLCKGIREAFDLREYPNVLIWEQYLNKPLTP